jgi:hypothetical protein
VDVRLQDTVQWLRIKLPHFISYRLPPVPPWDIAHPTCDLRLNRYARGATPVVTYRRYISELLSHFPDHTAVYTDGSFLQELAGSTFVYSGCVIYRHHCFNRVFTTELYALYSALLSFAAIQDFTFCLCTLYTRFAMSQLLLCHHPVVAEILLQVSDLRTSGQSVVCCWVPGHCGLPDNEPSTDRSFQIELSALTSVLAFFALFYPRC